MVAKPFIMQLLLHNLPFTIMRKEAEAIPPPLQKRGYPCLIIDEEERDNQNNQICHRFGFGRNN